MLYRIIYSLPSTVFTLHTAVAACMNTACCTVLTNHQVRSARRLQSYARALLRNRELRKNVEGVFAAARRGDVREV